MPSKQKEITGTSLDFTAQLASELKPAAPDGKLAKQLNLPVPETSFVDADSLVTPAFVSRTGFDYQALINEITDEAEAVPRPLTDKEKAAVAKCTAAKAAKEAADAATFTPLRAVDAQVMDRIGRHANDVDAYLESVLLPGEVSLTSIRAVAFKGLVGPRLELKVGKGMLLLTAVPKPGATNGEQIHRLHFYLSHHASEFEVKRSFYPGAGHMQPNGALQAKQTVRAAHMMNGTFATSFVEDNVVHVHTEVEEVSKYVSELNAKTFGTEEVQCGQCLKKCMDVLCCKKKDEEDEIVVPVAGGNTWQATARSNPDAAARLEQLLVVPWETVTENKIVNFSGMPKALPNGVHLEAGTARTAHTVHLTMRNSATNSVEEGMCIVDPATPLADIVKFNSLVQMYSVPSFPAWPKDVEQWSTMGFKASPTLNFLGGGGFGGPLSAMGGGDPAASPGKACLSKACGIACFAVKCGCKIICPCCICCLPK